MEVGKSHGQNVNFLNDMKSVYLDETMYIKFRKYICNKTKMVFNVFSFIIFLSLLVAAKCSPYESKIPDSVDFSSSPVDHHVDLDVEVFYTFSSEDLYPRLDIDFSGVNNTQPCPTQFFVDFVEPEVPVVVDTSLGLPTTRCSNHNLSHIYWGSSRHTFGTTMWSRDGERIFVGSDVMRDIIVGERCEHAGTVAEQITSVTLMQQEFTQRTYQWKVYVCQITILNSQCSAEVSQDVVAKTCKQFPASFTLVPNVVSSLQTTKSIALSAADFFLSSFDAASDPLCQTGFERGSARFTLILPRDFVSFSSGSVHKVLSPEPLRGLVSVEDLKVRFLDRISDERQLWEFTLTTGCVDTKREESGARGDVNAFKSLFAPEGTGYARFAFSIIGDINNMNVQMNLNLLVTPNFFQLTNDIMQHGPVYANHALHIGVPDALQNEPGFTGFYLLDDYVCSKQSLDSGPAALKPVRVAFCVLTPEASKNPFAGKTVQVQVKNQAPFNASFGCQEESWLDMAHAKYNATDDTYLFDSEPRVVVGQHEIILWFVQNSQLSRDTVPAIYPQEIGVYLDSFMAYYDPNTQKLITHAKGNADVVEVWYPLDNLNCSHTARSCNLACFRMKAVAPTLNKKFLVHHDSVAHYDHDTANKRRKLLGSDNQTLNNILVGKLLQSNESYHKIASHEYSTIQYDLTSIDVRKNATADETIKSVKDFQEELFFKECVLLEVNVTEWKHTCEAKRDGMKCSNKSVNVTRVKMLKETVTNVCGETDTTQLWLVLIYLTLSFICFFSAYIMCFCRFCKR